MFRHFIILLTAVSMWHCYMPAPSSASRGVVQKRTNITARLLDAEDADTLILDTPGGSMTVHLVGVDGSGLSDEGLAKARAFLKSLLRDKTIVVRVRQTLNPGTVRADVFYGSTGKEQRLVADLLRAGWVRISSPATASKADLALEAEAKKVGRGRWAKGGTPASVSGLVYSFKDDFKSLDTTNKRWKLDVSFGRFDQRERQAVLTAERGGFPILCTRTDPFPKTGAWTFSVGYRFNRAGAQSGSILCVNRATGKAVLTLRQEPNLQQQVLLLNDKLIWTAPVDNLWRTVSLVRNGQQFSVYVNGVKVSERAVEHIPDWIVVGGGVASTGTEWTELGLQFVTVAIGQRITDQSALRDTGYEIDPKTLPKRQALADLGASAYDLGSGPVGRVNGLSVRRVGNLWEYGKILTVTATVVPGSGRIVIDSNQTASSRRAIDYACTFAKLKVATMGKTLDWKSLDIDVTYPSVPPTIILDGNSAGAANAVAIVAAALNARVDESVAITGAIDPQGNIDPVGGIVPKAEAAMAADKVAIIMPNHPSVIAELDRLSFARPLDFFGRRWLLVKHLDQVLPHVLVGYSNARLQAANLMRDGFARFAEGDDAGTLKAFSAARRLTPEDATIVLWERFVQANYIRTYKGTIKR